MKRRNFIVGGLTIVALPTLYVLSKINRKFEKKGDWKTLSPREAATILALAEAIIPNNNSFGISAADADILGGVDRMIAASPDSNQRRLHTVLTLVEYILPLRIFSLTPFSELSIAQRQDIISRFDRSPSASNRALARGLKGMIQAIYYEDPKVLAKLGHENWCHK